MRVHPITGVYYAHQSIIYDAIQDDIETEKDNPILVSSESEKVIEESTKDEEYVWKNVE